MCTCDFTLSEIDNEEMSIHDVIQATVDDFNQTIDYLAKHRRTQTCLRHLYDLIVFIQRDDSFCFMEPDRDIFITVGLSCKRWMKRKKQNGGKYTKAGPVWRELHRHEPTF